MARRSNSVNMTPAFAGSLILHVGLFVLVLILGVYFKKPPSMPGGVPVTIVSEGPPQFSNAPLADEEQVSQAETVAEIDEPEVAPPSVLPPDPATPPKPLPKPAPSPTGKGKATPPRDLDFDRLLKDVQTAKPGRTKPPTGAQAGAPKSATAIKVGSGKRLSGSTQGYLLTLGDELGRKWRPNCLVEGGADVKVTVRFTVAPSRTLLAPPKSSADGSTSSMILAAGDRAKRAVWAADYDTFPPELFGEELIVPFDASVVCGKH